MEEVNTKRSIQPAVAEPNGCGRKDYVPPVAEIVLFVPEEQLSVWDYKYSDFDDAANRWAIGKWAGFASCPDSGVTGGITNPEGWALPATSET